MLKARLIICLLTLLALSVCLSACESESLLENINSQDSIEITVRLREAGIQATRVASGGSRQANYSIEVPEKEYQQSLKVLHELGLPKERKETLDELTSPKGFVPNSKEISALRLDHALALEVERLLEALPGVVESRAVVRSNYKTEENASSGQTASSVSVVLRYQTKSNKQPFTDEEVKEVVMQSVPGLKPEAISVKANQVFLAFGGSGLGGAEYVKLWPFSFEISKLNEKTAARQLGIGLIVAIVCGVIIALSGQKGLQVMSNRASEMKSLSQGEEQTLLPEDENR